MQSNTAAPLICVSIVASASQHRPLSVKSAQRCHAREEVRNVDGAHGLGGLVGLLRLAVGDNQVLLASDVDVVRVAVRVTEQMVLKAAERTSRQSTSVSAKEPSVLYSSDVLTCFREGLKGQLNQPKSSEINLQPTCTNCNAALNLKSQGLEGFLTPAP